MEQNIMRVGVIGASAIFIALCSWVLIVLACLASVRFYFALQGLSRGVESMLLTTARQAVLPVAFALLLRGFGMLEPVWASFLLGERAVIPIAARVWRRARREIETRISL